MRTATEQYGGSVTQVVMFDPASDDMTPYVRQLAHADGRKRATAQQLHGKSDAASKEALRKLLKDKPSTRTPRK